VQAATVLVLLPDMQSTCRRKDVNILAWHMCRLENQVMLQEKQSEAVRRQQALQVQQEQEEEEEEEGTDDDTDAGDGTLSIRDIHPKGNLR